ILVNPADPNAFGSSRLIVKYEPKGAEKDSKSGVAIVDVLGEDYYGGVGADGKPVVEQAFRALPQIVAGDGFSVALNIAGQVLTWGTNDRGQLGTGASNAYNITPTINETMDRALAQHYGNNTHYIAQVAAGARHVLALDDQGGVWVWGDNAMGQLGLGEKAAEFYSEPQYLSTLGTSAGGVRIRNIYALDTTSYVVDAQGTLYAFGSGESFMKETGKQEVGPGGEPILLSYGNVPTPLSLLARTLEVANGYVLKGSGTIWALPASNVSPDVYRLSDGTDGGGTTVTGAAPNRNIVSISGHSDEFTLTDNGIVTAVKERHLLAIDKKGDLWSLGNNHFGQLGQKSNSGSEVLLPVVEKISKPGSEDTFRQLGKVNDIAAGDSFSAAISKTVAAVDETLYTKTVTDNTTTPATVTVTEM
ncbi:MAG: hypothetical protein RRY53_07105, partial [Pseudoflavonifractor sp.]